MNKCKTERNKHQYEIDESQIERKKHQIETNVKFHDRNVKLKRHKQGCPTSVTPYYAKTLILIFP